MRNLATVIVAVFMSWMSNAQAQPLTIDPESIVPLPNTFDMEMPASASDCPVSRRVDRNLAR